MTLLAAAPSGGVALLAVVAPLLLETPARWRDLWGDGPFGVAQHGPLRRLEVADGWAGEATLRPGEATLRPGGALTAPSHC